MTAPRLAADFRPRVERVLSAFGRDVESEAGRLLVARAVAFADLVVKWNERVDLTAARDPDELIDLLLADAACIVRARARTAVGHEERETWFDIGSGLGAPGVALALLEPELRVTLVEPRQKRVAFLRTLLHALDRRDIAVERSRSEILLDLGCDVAVSRATLSPGDWLLEGARLARREVWVLLAREGPPEAPAGLMLAESVEYQWPLTGKDRRAACYRKKIAPATAQNSREIEK